MEFIRLHASFMFRAGLCTILAFCPYILFAQTDSTDFTVQSGGTSVMSATSTEEKEKVTGSRSKRVDATAAFTQGQFLESEGKKEEALEFYEKAALADPDFLPTVIRKASILVQLGKYNDALVTLQESLAKDPEDAEIEMLIAFCHIKKNNVDEAKKLTSQALDHALKDTSRSSEYYARVGEMIGRLIIELNSPTPTEYARQLLPIFERAAGNNSRNPNLLFRIAEMQIALGDHKKAIENYEKIYAMVPRFPQIREKLILTLLTIGKDDRAIELIEEILEKDPTHKKFYSVLGELYGRAKNWEKSEENYMMALRVGNNTAQDYILAALALLKNKKAPEAIRIIRDAEVKYPEAPQLPFICGISLRIDKQYKEAVESFANAEKIGSSQEGFLNSNFYFEYASCYEQAKDYESAEKMFRKALAIDPNNHMVMNYMAYSWAERNVKLNEAEKLLKRALELDPDNPAYQDSLGWVYYQKGRYEEARHYLELSLKQMSDDSVVNDHMGDIMFKLGHLAKAMEHWNNALPKSDERERIEAKIRKGKDDLAMQNGPKH